MGEEGANVGEAERAVNKREEKGKTERMRLEELEKIKKEDTESIQEQRRG